MKIYVNFYGLDEKKEDQKIGTIIFDGSKFTWANTAYDGIKEISDDSIFVEDELIDPKKDPEKFMQNLHKAYTGTYVRAGKVKHA